ncbi:hypothetical protein MSPP1_001581 [Malassezia sp. CBS 17886]|nr:hypothetical protein MSPP1_001581 [Malassezia sp. CBS 17886]
MDADTGGGLRQRNPYADDDAGYFSSARKHRPGQPIGYFSARDTPYQKKFISRKLIFCCLLQPLIAVIALVIILLPVLYAVAVHTLSVSVMHIYASNITDPGENSFPLSLEGQIKKASIFPATLYFREPVVVHWNTPPTDTEEMREVVLGQFNLDHVGVAANHGRLKQATQFNISDPAIFGEFTKYLINNEEFTWRLKCNNVHVEAISFIPTFKNLQLTKDVVFKGINNFPRVEILDFQLPSADPQGGLTFFATTLLDNPSPFGFQLGRLEVSLYSGGMLLGPGFSNNVNVTPGVNIVPLQGRLLPHFDNSTELDALGVIFTRYINGDVVPTSVFGDGVVATTGQTPSWLSTGIKSLHLNVPLKSPVPINPIKSITIKQFNLTYDEHTGPYSPTASSDSLSAVLALPFGFPLNIISAKNEIMIVDPETDTPMINVNGVYSDSETQLQVVADGQTSGTLYLTLKPSPMELPSQTDAAKEEFALFVKQFTFADKLPKLFNGSSSALSDTPMGRILLNGIRFSVESGLLGLQGLTAFPTTINGIDVVGGTRDGLQLAVNTTIISPSNVNIRVGDVTLLLVNEDVIGNVLLKNLNLNIGTNNLSATSTFHPLSSPHGMDTLNRYVSGIDTKVNISGSDQSTSIESLVPAFSAVRISTTLPGLKTQIVQKAGLTVLNTTGVTDDVANAVVSMNNPFSSTLQINKIQSNVTSHGVFVASIDTPVDITLPGKKVTDSPVIPLHLNLYPPDIFGLLRALVVQSGQDPRPLDGVVDIGGYTYTKSTDANGGPPPPPPAKRSVPLERRDTNIFTGFDLPSYVDKAFKSARANLAITASSQIGDYESPLTLVQDDVALQTDDTLNMLLPVLASPIVQKIVDGANLAIESVTILDPKEKSFRTHLIGSITNAGPFDADITFPEGLQITWNNKVLGQIAMPLTHLEADKGAQLNLMADFAVSDTDALMDFTKFLVTQPSFVWSISGRNLRVSALGINLTGVAINKNVILTGINSLKDAVNVTTYDLPANDPAGGIHLTAQATIKNPSQVGVQLSRFGTNVFSNSTNVGPAAAQSPFTLAALSTTQLPLAGRLVHQEGDGIKTLSTVFTSVVHGEAVPVEIRGAFAGPEEVTWLNEGIKSLSVKTELPPRRFNVLKAVTLNQLSLFFNKDDQWNPKTFSSDTEAPFFLPFAFPLDIQHAGGTFIQRYLSSDNAVLDVPMSPATTDVQKRIMTLKFANVPFAVKPDKQKIFSQFLADTTADKNVTFGLHGNANAVANTAAGAVTISDIPFDLNTTLAGLQNLGVRPVVSSDLDVKRGTKDYLEITLIASMVNPSHLTIGAGDVAFGLLFQNRPIGTANIAGLKLVPGVNNVSAAVHYQPVGQANTAAGQVLLENYVQGDLSNASIKGSKDATPIVPLQQAFSGITLQTQIPPLHQLLIIEARLVIPKNIDQTSTAQATFQLQNPFTASINLLKVNASAIYEGVTLGAITQDLSKNPVSAPGHKTITSRSLPLKMNLDPKNLIKFIRKAAVATKTDLGPLQQQFDIVNAMNNTDTPLVARPDDNPPDWHSGKQFDVFGAVLGVLKGLKVKLVVQTTTKLDDYQTNLDIKQEPVPTDTDKTALYLIGPVGKPIVQNIVEEAKLQFSLANITNVKNDGFDLALKGSLLDTGPFDAQIEFPQGLKVNYNGNDIAMVYLPPIRAVATEGVPNLITHGSLKITDNKRFTDFAKYLLHNKEFQWTVHSDELIVRALNIKFSKVVISKKINFKAFNNLPGVVISAFDVPSDTDNALNIAATGAIPSPATLGIELDTANFDIFYMNEFQGPVHSTNLFLAGNATTSAKLQGQITSKTTDKAKNATGQLFSLYLQGINQTLAIKGKNVKTKANGNKPVKWLSDAFKTLTLQVILPGKMYKILYSLTISDLFVTLLDTSKQWEFPTGSNQSLAVFANPLHFHLKPLKAGLDAYLQFANEKAAHLVLPLLDVQSGTSTSPQDFQTLSLGWKKEPLKAVNHAAFQALFKTLTDTKQATFGVYGTADLIGQLPIGKLRINGIPFNLTSKLPGVNSLNHNATVHSLDLTGAVKSRVIAKAQLSANNPSNLTVKTTNLAIPAFYQNVYVGRALLCDTSIVPGVNNLEAKFFYEPANPNDTTAQKVITGYLEPVQNRGATAIPQYTPLDLHGFANAQPPLTPFEALRPAAEGLSLDAVLPGLGVRLIGRIDVVIDILQLFAGRDGLTQVFIYVLIFNDLPLSLSVINLQGYAHMAGEALDGPKYATFSALNFKGCTVPAAKATKVDHGQFTCPPVRNVLLDQGLLNSLPLIGKNLDVFLQIGARAGGNNGYFLPGLQYNQFDINTTYSLSIGDTVLLNVTSAEELLKGITDNMGKLNPGQRQNVAKGLQSLGIDGVSKLANNGLQSLVCATEDALPLDFLKSANCKSGSNQSKGGSGGSGSSGGSSNPLGISVPGLSPSPSSPAGNNKQPAPSPSSSSKSGLLGLARIATTDVLLLLEHTPVYTLGRRDDDAANNTKASPVGAEVYHTKRGGLLTYHGPGQLVGYPIFDLSQMGLSTRSYVAGLQDALRGALVQPAIGLSTVDAPSDDSKYTGIWIDRHQKIASFGVHVRHRVTSHGFALNVHAEALDGFRAIVACGLPDVRMTCVDEQLCLRGESPHLSVPQVARICADALAARLGRTAVPAPKDVLNYVAATTPPESTDAVPVLSHAIVDGECIGQGASL